MTNFKTVARSSFVAAAVLAAAFLLLPAPLVAAAQIKHEIGANGVAVFRASGLALPAPALEILRGASAERLREIFFVRVADAGESAPAIAGTCSVDSGALIFRPKFSLEPGVRYIVTLDEARLNRLLAAHGIAWRGDASTQFAVLTKRVEIPAADATPVAVVAQVFPSADVLPENQLKFYVHFSAPMQQGDAYRHIKLYDGSGALVELPFLELTEELWDRTGTRFTLFVDPGRIKLGVKPREDVGVALKEGTRFALVIESTWPDAEGRPLKTGFRKEFQVAPADRASPDPAKWKLRVPRAGSRDPLVVEFGESLDHALLQRLVWVNQRLGAAVAGEAKIGPQESSWSFVPTTSWMAGDYDLRVGSVLEDLAGNSIARPFDRDLLAGEKSAGDVSEFVNVPFAVR